MQEHAVGASVFEEGDLKSAGHALVAVKVVLELTSRLRFDFLDRSDGVAAVASAATVLEGDEVGRILVTKDLVWLLGGIHI